MPETVTIRARLETRDRLQEVAKHYGEAGVQTLDRLVNRAYDELLLAEMIEGIESPGVDDDIAAWDGASGDGIDDA